MSEIPETAPAVPEEGPAIISYIAPSPEVVAGIKRYKDDLKALLARHSQAPSHHTDTNTGAKG